MLQPWSRL